MDAPSDFRELLESFNAHGVEYLVVGGFALAFHGAPRFTGDLGLTREDFTRDDSVVQLGLPPVRIDLLTSLSGVNWNDAFRGRTAGELGGVVVAFIGRGDFVANKRSTGRLKDLADLEALGEQ